MAAWLDAFQTMASPILALGVMILMGVVIARLRILDERGVGALTRLVVALLLPALLFSKFVKGFRPGEQAFAGWYWLPVSSWLLLASAYGLAWLLHRLLAGRGSSAARRITFATLCGWQNAGYIPIPIIAAIYAGDPARRDQVLVYCFLFILGFSPTMWSLGPFNMARASTRSAQKLDWKRLVTPPFVATVSGVSLCLLNVPQWVSSTFTEETFAKVMAPLETVGDTCIPIIMILLGAMLARRRSEAELGARFAWGVIAVKLILLPAATGAFILCANRLQWRVNPGFLALFFIQAASPPATGLTVIARRYGGARQSELVNRAVLWSYVAGAVTLPLWLTVGRGALGLFE